MSSFVVVILCALTYIGFFSHPDAFSSNFKSRSQFPLHFFLLRYTLSTFTFVFCIFYSSTFFSLLSVLPQLFFTPYSSPCVHSVLSSSSSHCGIVFYTGCSHVPLCHCLLAHSVFFTVSYAPFSNYHTCAQSFFYSFPLTLPVRHIFTSSVFSPFCQPTDGVSPTLLGLHL